MPNKNGKEREKFGNYWVMPAVAKIQSYIFVFRSKQLILTPTSPFGVTTNPYGMALPSYFRFYRIWFYSVSGQSRSQRMAKDFPLNFMLIMPLSSWATFKRGHAHTNTDTQPPTHTLRYWGAIKKIAGCPVRPCCYCNPFDYELQTEKKWRKSNRKKGCSPSQDQNTKSQKKS